MASRNDILTTAPTFCRLAERFTGPLHQVDLVHLYIINNLSLTPISLLVNLPRRIRMFLCNLLPKLIACGFYAPQSIGDECSLADPMPCRFEEPLKKRRCAMTLLWTRLRNRRLTTSVSRTFLNNRRLTASISRTFLNNRQIDCCRTRRTKTSFLLPFALH